MFIFRTVVGKLWLTIIGLVFVVLTILGIFLVNFIGEYFSLARDQKASLTQLAHEYAVDAKDHMNDDHFYTLSNKLLAYQDTQLLVLNDQLQALNKLDTSSAGIIGFQATDFFSTDELKQVLEGNDLISQIPQLDDNTYQAIEGYFAVAVPLLDPSQNHIGALVLYQSLQSLDTIQSYVIHLFIYVSLIGFTMTTVFAFFLFSRITRPLQQLKKAAYLISQREYDTTVPVMTNDEIGDLAISFNHMVYDLHSNIDALSQEKEHLSSVLRSMTDAVITCDAAGHVILTNPQGEKLVQAWSEIDWSVDTESSLPASSMLSIPQPLVSIFESVVENSREASTNIQVLNAVWSVAMTPLYAQSQVRGAVAVLRDVTEEFRLDKLRKDFVANVSHELRTPVSMLQGYSEALLDNIVSTPIERNQLVQVIHEESLRMGRLVGDLLDLARMEAGHFEMQFREVELRTLIQRTYRKFFVLAKERNIELQFVEPESLYILEFADVDRLEQVFTNLLDNALRHSSEGQTISIQMNKSSLRGLDAIEVKIIDQGSGIPAEDLPYVFERFYKADKARTRVTDGGTGLGLAIVKNIIDAHQGTVHVQSQLRSGTTFTIVLPMVVHHV